MLSAIAHHNHPDRAKVLDALAAGLADLEDDRAARYADVVAGALPAAARQHWETLMSTTYYKSGFARSFVNQGRAEGEAAAVLAVLAARGIDVPEPARARITGCTDLDQLDAWVRAAATADSIEDLFS